MWITLTSVGWRSMFFKILFQFVWLMATDERCWIMDRWTFAFSMRVAVFDYDEVGGFSD